MQSHDSRDLDGTIDDVARAMTSEELSRDLRPAIAARLAPRPSWSIGWRVATAAAAMAVVVLAIAVVSRPGRQPQQTRPTAGPGAPPAVARAEQTERIEPRTARPARRVARQTIVRAATAGIVEIGAVTIVPLEETPDAAQAPQQVVLIAPIDVERVQIAELGDMVE